MGDKKLAIDNICKQLFEDNLNTFQITELFDDKFHNQVIESIGVVNQVAKFNYDFVFKNTKGVKVTLNAYELSSFGNPKVQAVIHFPAEMLEQLQELKGKEISFSGAMIKVAPTGRKIFIEKGELVDNDKPEEEPETPEKETKEPEKEKDSDEIAASLSENEDIKKADDGPEVDEEAPHKRKRKRKRKPGVGYGGYTQADLAHLKEMKKLKLNIIIAVAVIIIVVGIYLGLNIFFKVMHYEENKDRKPSRKTTRVNFKRNSPNSMVINNSQKPSPLSPEFHRINRNIRNTRINNVQDLDAAIAKWQKFVDKHEGKRPNDPNVKQAKITIKNLQDLKTMY